jgi:hypothetical protein
MKSKLNIGNVVYVKRLGNLVPGKIVDISKSGKSSKNPGEEMYKVKFEYSEAWIIKTEIAI